MRFAKSKSGLYVPDRQRGFIHPGLLHGRVLLPRPMEVVSASFGASTGNVDITTPYGRDKTPIAAMFFSGWPNDDGVARMCVGAFDGTNQWVTAIQDLSGVTTTYSTSLANTTRCVYTLGGGMSEEGVALIPNGVRLNVTSASFNRNVLVALFFDDDGSAVASTFDPHFKDGSSVTVTPGIPTTALVTVPSHQLFNDTSVYHAKIGIGFAVNGGNQAALGWRSVDYLSTSSVTSTARDNRGTSFTSGTAAPALEYGSFTATQFGATTRSTINLPSAWRTGYLCLNMPNAQAFAGRHVTPTTTGWDSITGAGFEALSGLFATNILYDPSSFARFAEGFGVAAATKDVLHTARVASEDNVSTTDTESYFTNSISASGADDYLENIATGFRANSDGADLNFTTVDGVAGRYWPFLLLGRA